MQHVELMSPAGSFASLRAAIQSGADAVYFGVGQLHMRSRAANEFEMEHIQEIVQICEEGGVRSYLVFNTILYDDDLTMMHEIFAEAKKAGVSAVIVNDNAAIQHASEIGLEVHISTQQNVSNIEAVKYFSQFADVVVLARELDLEKITKICEQIKEEDIRGPSGELMLVELFVHGALCVAKAGTCSMSLSLYNESANRGACLQACRRSYKVIDEQTGNALQLDNSFVMSPKDLCTIGVLDQIIGSGVSILKLEGRGRSPDYVQLVTSVYREGIDAVRDGSFSQEKVEGWMKRLETVFNRGFWQGGYYLGNKLGEWSADAGSQATKKKIIVGKVLHYFTKAKIAHISVDAEPVSIGDELLITGSNTGALSVKIESMYVDKEPAETAEKQQECTITVPDQVRVNDKVFKVVDR